MGASEAPGVPAGGSIISYASGGTNDVVVVVLVVDDDEEEEAEVLMLLFLCAASSWCGVVFLFVVGFRFRCRVPTSKVVTLRTKCASGKCTVVVVVGMEARVRPRLHTAAADDDIVCVTSKVGFGV